MPRKAEAYIEEILCSIQAIENFVSTMNLSEYEKDIKTKSATERMLLNIGEALKQLIAVDPGLESKKLHYT